MEKEEDLSTYPYPRYRRYRLDRIPVNLLIGKRPCRYQLLSRATVHCNLSPKLEERGEAPVWGL